MGSQGPGRKRTTSRNGLTAEGDALNLIAREAESRLAAKRAARAEAREIRMRELERQQKEEDSERYTRHSHRHSSLSDDEDQTSVVSRSNQQLSEYSGYFGSSSRTSSRVSSRCQSPVLDDRLEASYVEKASSRASALSTATLTSLGETSRTGSGESSVTADTELSLREMKEIHELKDQIQDVESKYAQTIKDLKDSLAEMEEKYRKAMVSNAQFDNEKSNLMYQVDTLKDSLSELEELLSESRREYEERCKDLEREKYSHSVLQFQFNELKETLKQGEELLTEIRQLRLAQDGHVRDISDLQETIEWKNKKIGALEKQKEYSDAIRNERDELRDEVVQLRDILKKHGIVLGPDLSTNKEVGGDVTDEPASTEVQEKSSMLGSQEMQLNRDDESVEGSRGDRNQQPEDLDHGKQKNSDCTDNGFNEDSNLVLNHVERTQIVVSEAEIGKTEGLEPVPITEEPAKTNDDQPESQISTENSENLKIKNEKSTGTTNKKTDQVVQQQVVQDKKAVEPPTKKDKISEQPQSASTPSKKKKKKKKNKQKQKKTNETDDKECDAQPVVDGSCENTMESSLDATNDKEMPPEPKNTETPKTDEQKNSQPDKEETNETETVKEVNKIKAQEGQNVSNAPEDDQREDDATVTDTKNPENSTEIPADKLLIEKQAADMKEEHQEPIDDAPESRVEEDEIDCGKSSLNEFHSIKSQQDNSSDVTCDVSQLQDLTDPQDADTDQQQLQTDKQDPESSVEEQEQASLDRDQPILTEAEHGEHQQQDVDPAENEDQDTQNHQEIMDN
ncbi:leucine-rich repeat flightless-interacting protein 1 isoform X2 [Astyanax mexicanus]|uniref:leucine-rich repeat flightless-interacting protein 1 isoform X2 n=1 Tax=Astyanax mexicanus TaxID=7994 RepID=UPI0020CABD2E|nr:leucine-rich repeat flightless-interacting protein 1 isoform X2 [Astyanax mexicanus]